MDTVKARIQGNATVVTIPKSFDVKPGTEYRFSQGKGGVLTLTPTEELFKNWHGEYQMPDDLKVWQNAKPEGEELW